MRVNAREARQRFSELLDRAERGEEVVIERRGRSPVRLVAGESHTTSKFPDLTEFRQSVAIDGALSDVVIEERNESRY